MEVTSLLFFLSMMIGNEPVLEQPANSILPKIKPLSTVLQACHAIRTSVRLGAYGDSTSPAKPLQLWHIHPLYANLHKTMVKSTARATLTTRYIDKKGKKRFSGNAQMKSSQAYPPPFCAKVAQLTLNRRAMLS
jgi:hypothetical protein